MNRFHWNYVDVEHEESVINGWKSEGCYDTIMDKIGYRLYLRSTILPKTVESGFVACIQVIFINNGYAAPMNPIDVRLVLRKGDAYYETWPLFYFSSSQPRLAGSFTATQSIRFNVPAGEYEMLLEFSDALPRNKPDFNIMMHNEDVPEINIGMNNLLHTVNVTEGSNEYECSGFNRRSTPVFSEKKRYANCDDTVRYAPTISPQSITTAGNYDLTTNNFFVTSSSSTIATSTDIVTTSPATIITAKATTTTWPTTSTTTTTTTTTIPTTPTTPTTALSSNSNTSITNSSAPVNTTASVSTTSTSFPHSTSTVMPSRPLTIPTGIEPACVSNLIVGGGLTSVENFFPYDSGFSVNAGSAVAGSTSFLVDCFQGEGGGGFYQRVNFSQRDAVRTLTISLWSSVNVPIVSMASAEDYSIYVNVMDPCLHIEMSLLQEFAQVLSLLITCVQDQQTDIEGSYSVLAQEKYVHFFIIPSLSRATTSSTTLVCSIQLDTSHGISSIDVTMPKLIARIQAVS